MTHDPAYFWTAWTTLTVLAMYVWVVFNVGRARGRFRIDAPAMEGPPPFMIALRVQANTVEQLILFLPALWLCAVFRSDVIAAIGGATWLVGRLIYAFAYYRDPAKRGPGFVVALLSTLGLGVAAASGLMKI